MELPAAVIPADPSPRTDRSEAEGPLGFEELVQLLQSRWQASYDLQLVQRRGRLHLQVMWAYLEQQSFPLDAEAYANKLEALLEVVNGLGVAEQVRQWLRTTRDKPRLGKAMSLTLEPMVGGRSREFLL
ncbi:MULTISPECIES: DUF3067 family protein [unclassified Synechococcus]|uniref:DUF3067 family protein n=1 Tax=unclassified Synechococcus TaxID=2626047 RepID=UPI0021A901E0|nr:MULTISPECIES: DUF3067 family protein [unclassified Synechococcus]MCT0214115.1 DUF3067 family protein [Synechococcus sp. CS-1326]MCT0232445.1 DUF3067 family protein [Synechococcus sp. CS-1327]